MELEAVDENGGVSLPVVSFIGSNVSADDGDDDEDKKKMKIKKNRSKFIPPPFSRTGLHAAWYSTPADVYSFATILWELLTGGTPYTGLTKKAQVVLVVSRHHARPLIPPHCPLALAQLIRRCWHPDPSCRPSAAFSSIVLERLLEEGLRLWKEVVNGGGRRRRRKWREGSRAKGAVAI
jgi:serine/threonine protein kinase